MRKCSKPLTCLLYSLQAQSNLVQLVSNRLRCSNSEVVGCELFVSYSSEILHGQFKAIRKQKRQTETKKRNIIGEMAEARTARRPPPQQPAPQLEGLHQVSLTYRVLFLFVPPNFQYQNEKRSAANQRFCSMKFSYKRSSLVEQRFSF